LGLVAKPSRDITIFGTSPFSGLLFYRSCR
jgi:hypothetical protein